MGGIAFITEEKKIATTFEKKRAGKLSECGNRTEDQTIELRIKKWWEYQHKMTDYFLTQVRLLHELHKRIKIIESLKYIYCDAENSVTHTLF